MTLRIVSGTANHLLADAVAAQLRAAQAPCVVERFPDGELRPVVEGVRGADVYVVEPTGPPVHDHLVELLLVLDACRRVGAARVTAVVPYFGYARQDRRSRGGEAVGARVMADAIRMRADRLVVVDPHTVALEAMCDLPVEMLTAVPVLAGALAGTVPSGAVVVAPDLGAVKLAEHYASCLKAPVAVVRKSRKDGTTVYAEELVGHVEGRPTIVVDDMISTGATIEAAVGVLRSHGATSEMVVVATHRVFATGATDRLRALPVLRVVVTDSLPQHAAPVPTIEVRSIAPLLADAIDRLHRNQALDDLLVRT